MIGDKISDVELGKKIGAKTVMVKTGYGRGELELFSHQWKTKPDFVAEDLWDAVDWALKSIGMD